MNNLKQAGNKNIHLVRTSPDQYKGKIGESWRKTLKGILETAKLLVEAELHLHKEDWNALLEDGLPFHRTIAYKLIKVAKDSRINDPAHVHLMPSSYGTLYEIAKLKDEEFAKAKESHVLNSKVQRKDIISFIKKERGLENKPKTNQTSGKKIAELFVDEEKVDPLKALKKLAEVFAEMDGVHIKYIQAK